MSTHPYTQQFTYPTIHLHLTIYPTVYLAIQSPTNPIIYLYNCSIIHLSIHLPIHLCNCPIIHPSIYPSNPTCNYSSIQLSSHPSIHPFIYPIIHLCNCPIIHPASHPSAHPLIHPLPYISFQEAFVEHLPYATQWWTRETKPLLSWKLPCYWGRWTVNKEAKK